MLLVLAGGFAFWRLSGLSESSYFSRTISTKPRSPNPVPVRLMIRGFAWRDWKTESHAGRFLQTLVSEIPQFLCRTAKAFDVGDDVAGGDIVRHLVIDESFDRVRRNVQTFGNRKGSPEVVQSVDDAAGLYEPSNLLLGFDQGPASVLTGKHVTRQNVLLSPDQVSWA